MRFHLIGLVLVLGVGCSESMTDYNAFEEAEKVVLAGIGAAEFVYWELPENERLWGEAIGKVPALEQYKDSLKQALGDQIYTETINKEASQNLPKSVLENIENDDWRNAMLVHTGSLGKIRKINYLEAQILNYQMERYPFFSHPTEFHSFIAVNDSLQLVRAYLAASNTKWPPRPTAVIQHLDESLENGWTLKYHFHDHFESPETQYLGILAPSKADAFFYGGMNRKYKYEKVLITNGFHTLELAPGEVAQFESY